MHALADKRGWICLLPGVCKDTLFEQCLFLILNIRAIFNGVFYVASLCDWSTRSTRSTNQVQSYKKITTWSPAFSRNLGNLVDFSWSSHWFLRVFYIPLIIRCDKFGFGFMTLNRKAFYKSKLNSQSSEAPCECPLAHMQSILKVISSSLVWTFFKGSALNFFISIALFHNQN